MPETPNQDTYRLPLRHPEHLVFPGHYQRQNVYNQMLRGTPNAFPTPRNVQQPLGDGSNDPRSTNLADPSFRAYQMNPLMAGNATLMQARQPSMSQINTAQAQAQRRMTNGAGQYANPAQGWSGQGPSGPPGISGGSTMLPPGMGVLLRGTPLAQASSSNLEQASNGASQTLTRQPSGSLLRSQNSASGSDHVPFQSSVHDNDQKQSAASFAPSFYPSEVPYNSSNPPSTSLPVSNIPGSNTSTPGSAPNPPLLEDSRDAYQIQAARLTQPAGMAASQSQGVQLNLPGGSQTTHPQNHMTPSPYQYHPSAPRPQLLPQTLHKGPNSVQARTTIGSQSMNDVEYTPAAPQGTHSHQADQSFPPSPPVLQSQYTGGSIVGPVTSSHQQPPTNTIMSVRSGSVTMHNSPTPHPDSNASSHHSSNPPSANSVDGRHPAGPAGPPFARLPPPPGTQVAAYPQIQPNLMLPFAAAPRYLASAGLATLGLLEFVTGIRNMTAETDMDLWRTFVLKHFHTTGTFDFAIWKMSETRQFNLKQAVIARFFHRTYACGLKSLNISFHAPQETVIAPTGQSLRVEASWTYVYNTGYRVTLVGPMEAHFFFRPLEPQLNEPQKFGWKFSYMKFVATNIEKQISVDAIEELRRQEGLTQMATGELSMDENRIDVNRARLPADPVNAFGIPQPLLICLDLSHNLGDLTDLYQYSIQQGIGPIDSLAMLAENVRQTNPAMAAKVDEPRAVPQQQPGPQAFSSTPGLISDVIMGALHTPRQQNATPHIANARVPSTSPMQPRTQSRANNAGPSAPDMSTPPNLPLTSRSQPTIPPSSSSDSSTLSSPPDQKRKAPPETEPSSSASDPPPTSLLRRSRTQSSSIDATSPTTSTRSSTRQKKHSSPKPATGRLRRRGV